MLKSTAITNIFYFYSVGIDFSVYRRQILATKVNHRAVRVKEGLHDPWIIIADQHNKIHITGVHNEMSIIFFCGTLF